MIRLFIIYLYFSELNASLNIDSLFFSEMPTCPKPQAVKRIRRQNFIFILVASPKYDITENTKLIARRDGVYTQGGAGPGQQQRMYMILMKKSLKTFQDIKTPVTTGSLHIMTA